MINFIVVDDFPKITDIIKKIINNRMMGSNLDYKTHIFHDYDAKFKKISNTSLPNKVYFLDIETKSASGIDVARSIRKNDVNSVIIFITAHEQLAASVIKESLMALTFICKFDDFENKISNAVDKSLEVLNNNRLLRLDDSKSSYLIPIKDILYITRDSVERKSVIKTDYAVYKVSATLTEIKNLSNGYLQQAHKSCLVNDKRIRKIDKVNNIITFDNNETIDLLSKNHREELL